MTAFSRGVLLGFAALAIAIQAYRPSHSDPPIDPARTIQAAVRVPPDIQRILSRSCMDCHSDQTHWPWYSYIAPVSWIIVDHVTNGRRHLNFSEWLRPDVDDPTEYTRQKLISACREVKLGRMPLSSYEILHSGARLSAGDIRAFCAWSEEPLAGKQLP